MRIDNGPFSANNSAKSKRPLYVIRISFDNDNTDFLYLTSHSNVALPSGVTSIQNVVRGVSGLSQQINPDRAHSTIGSFSFSVIDKDSSVSEHIQTKLIAGNGLRHKQIRVYVGFAGMTWANYQPILTYLIDGISNKNGEIKFRCSDIQRTQKKTIFDPEVTYLNKSILKTDTHIPATLSDLTLFPTVYHDTSYTVRPSESVGYIRLNDEIIAHTGLFNHGTDGPSFQVATNYTGTHTGSSNASVLTDSTKSWATNELVGLPIANTTDGSVGVIASNTATTVTATLTGGTDNDWDASDAYSIYNGRGALNTRAADHNIDTGAADDRRPKITEHVFIEGAAPKVAYQILTGHVSENLCLQSEDFSTTWTTTGASAVTNVDTAPDGTATADRLDVTASSSTHEFRQTVTVTTSTTNTASCFVKNNGERYAFITYWQSGTNFVTAVFDLTNKVATTTEVDGSTIVDYGIIDHGEWSRIYVSANLGAFTSVRIYVGAAGDAEPGTYSSGIPQFTAVAGEDLLCWGAQVSQTRSVVPYYKTTSTAQSQKTLPDNWHLGINTDLIKLGDFTRLGRDVWNQFDDKGRHVRFEGYKKVDGKQFIEKELYIWLWAFTVTYADGRIGVRRLSPVLSDSSYIVELNSSNVVNYGDLKHAYDKVINRIIAKWNYNFSEDDFTKTHVVFDTTSDTTHNRAEPKTFELKGVHTGAHTDSDLDSYFDSLRDRYSNPPKMIDIEVLPSLNYLEVGDTVRLKLDQITDFTKASGTTIDSVFEVQRVQMNWITGMVKLSLFGSSAKAGTIDRTGGAATVLADSYYTGSGTNLTGVLTISGGAVTANGSITGDLSMDQAEYYYDGDLTINAGVTVTTTKNAVIKIKGALTINGTIDGSGQGLSGGVGGTAFATGGTTKTNASAVGVALFRNPEYLDDNATKGQSGYIGDTVSTRGTVLLPQKRDDYLASNIWGSILTPLVVEGEKKSVDYFPIINNSTSIDGLPGNLMGSSGSGSRAVITADFNTRQFNPDYRIDHPGGNGGAGGAGLIIVCRGLSFGAAGSINLSGGAGSAGTSAVPNFDTTSYWQTPSRVFHSGGGAGGYPGGLLVLLDGTSTPPDLGSKFTANTGDPQFPANAIYNGYEIAPGDSPINTFPGPEAPILQQSKTSSNYSLQYIPVAQTVEEEVKPPPQNVTNFTVSDFGVVANLAWDDVESPYLDKYEVRSGTTWESGTFIAFVKTNYLDIEVFEQGTYNYMVKALDIYGKESVTAATGSLTFNPKISEVRRTTGTDAYFNNTYYYRNALESKDGIYTTGTVTLSVGASDSYINVLTSTTVPVITWYTASSDTLDFTFDKRMLFRAKIDIPTPTSLTSGAYVAIGWGYAISNFFGFKFTYSAGLVAEGLVANSSTQATTTLGTFGSGPYYINAVLSGNNGVSPYTRSVDFEITDGTTTYTASTSSIYVPRQASSSSSVMSVYSNANPTGPLQSRIYDWKALMLEQPS